MRRRGESWFSTLGCTVILIVITYVKLDLVISSLTSHSIFVIMVCDVCAVNSIGIWFVKMWVDMITNCFDMFINRFLECTKN